MQAAVYAEVRAAGVMFHVELAEANGARSAAIARLRRAPAMRSCDPNVRLVPIQLLGAPTAARLFHVEQDRLLVVSRRSLGNPIVA